MTEDELLQVKSDEIRRLHRIANSKNRALEMALAELQRLKSLGVAIEPELLDELKESIG